jgi:hypothetical protein
MNSSFSMPDFCASIALGRVPKTAESHPKAFEPRRHEGHKAGRTVLMKEQFDFPPLETRRPRRAWAGPFFATEGSKGTCFGVAGRQRRIRQIPDPEIKAGRVPCPP